MSKVTPHEGTPLKLTKTLYKRDHKEWRVLEPIKGPLAVGDEVVVRVTLHTDRDMEYVHLKDYRGSGTRPTNVLSQYRIKMAWRITSRRKTRPATSSSISPEGEPTSPNTPCACSSAATIKPASRTSSACTPEFNSHSESIPPW